MSTGRAQPARQSHARLYGVRRADLVAGLTLLAASALWTWLTWGRLYDPIVDQGWYMQVATRLNSGDVLYRDMIWMYGPLPVYVLALLFRWLGTNVTSFLLLYAALGTLGCLLTYCVARFLLAPPLALLGTLALFLGGWWGGFVGYSQAYTGAVPLGAVVGLAFVICFLSCLQSNRLLWLVCAGLASGLAALIKPEFALACLGTGLLLLFALWLLPGAWQGDRQRSGRALVVYGVSAALVAGLGYGPLAYRAGWTHVWAGITGYDQDAILLQVWPPWGTPQSWLYIVSGLGLLLPIAAILAVLASPRAAKRRIFPVVMIVGLGLALALLPWRYLARMDPGLIAAMRSSWPVLVEQAIRVFWAPGTLVLTILIISLGVLWVRAHRQRQPLRWTTVVMTVLAVYTALAAMRSFFHPTGTFHFLYLDTLFPVLLFLAVVLLPQAIEARWQTPVNRPRVQHFLIVVLLAYAVAGVIYDQDYMSRLTAEWVAPRGTALYNPQHLRRQAWPALLDHILAHTERGDPIAVMGQEPGFYFWTGRRNPLRQDTLLPGMASSPADALEIVQRLERDPPRLIAIPQGVTYGRGWFWELDVGRQAYQDLAPVWQYIRDHYRFRTIVGGDTWGYAVYELWSDRP
jgi:hypothetical protein